MTTERIYAMDFSTVYPHYIKKVETKGHTKAELDEIIRWYTGYSQAEFQAQLEKHVTLEQFYSQAPQLNPARSLITGMICGVRLEEIKDPIIQSMRYVDKLVDELAHGKPMQKILRK